MGRQNKRSLQLKKVRSSKKQRSEERTSLQAALDVATEGDLDLQLPVDNESSSEDEPECKIIDGEYPDPYYGILVNWFSHKLSLLVGLIEDYLCR